MINRCSIIEWFSIPVESFEFSAEYLRGTSPTCSRLIRLQLSLILTHALFPFCIKFNYLSVRYIFRCCCRLVPDKEWKKKISKFLLPHNENVLSVCFSVYYKQTIRTRYTYRWNKIHYQFPCNVITFLL